MRTERLDIRVPRNGDYFEDWKLNDGSGQPIDLSGMSLDLRIRTVAGQGLVLASASITTADPGNGIFSVLISGASLAAVSGKSELVRLAYDLRLTYPDGIKAVPVAGQIILVPGATY